MILQAVAIGEFCPLIKRLITATAVLFALSQPVVGQEKSVRPGINDNFRDPNVKEWVERFEGESREVYLHRHWIVSAIGLETGMAVADIGAGTGLFTQLMALKVGPEGTVFAVDISPKFLDYIQQRAKEADLKNIKTVLATDESCQLPANSVDLVFICDTYHHFEFPQKTMQSIHKALKPKGRVVLIDFSRIPGESSDWILQHVRAGQEVFEAEIIESGFRKVAQHKDKLKENYLSIFEKVSKAGDK